ncbi:hypothetical protein [Niastella sp. OAS944]|uniref:hypothetical protein n=1 Tax=Niastella sp. OAS944 TaxID=2664089 RepID=UPI003495405B|nr:pectate lyase [Chitinophagaceae bacterium OAS944]
MKKTPICMAVLAIVFCIFSCSKPGTSEEEPSIQNDARTASAEAAFGIAGFATQNGGTTGGQGGTTVTATTYAQLKSYLESSTTYIKGNPKDLQWH